MSLQLSNVRLMADYNQKMNQAFYKGASILRDEQLTEPMGAFFGSILGTFNHLIVGDVVWLKRFAEHPSQFRALDEIRGRHRPASLDAQLHLHLESWWQDRQTLDATILAFVDELTETDMAATLCFHNMKGAPNSKPMHHLLQHFFNHQTHHRGQLSTLLHQQGIDVGVTDLLMCF